MVEQNFHLTVIFVRLLLRDQAKCSRDFESFAKIAAAIEDTRAAEGPQLIVATSRQKPRDGAGAHARTRSVDHGSTRASHALFGGVAMRCVGRARKDHTGHYILIKLEPTAVAMGSAVGRSETRKDALDASACAGLISQKVL
jgi:hypothetical protein